MEQMTWTKTRDSGVDGDKAMANAIKVVFPKARHRLCLWHLMRKAQSNDNFEFASGFIKCVNEYRTPKDFEVGLQELMSYYSVQHRKWAIDLYNDREKWTIEAEQQIQLNEDNFAHEEQDDIHDTRRRIKDPHVVILKKTPKGKKFRACSKCHGIGHTTHTCPKFGNRKSVGEKLREEFDLNEAYITSPQWTLPKSPKDIDHDYIDKVRELLMSNMSNLYVKGKMPQFTLSLFLNLL
ncbi:hypothetical protein Cgig2_012666 [Carnegiea gigantea]|uniref:MULE transposase domain-containing protein n=1 Tax=Carnegiea gigantea TaxID=171969 RepID=A0A9Q1K029_9CARY|nr:hypothetical protein Cgig2_012666 [Carnegiea gigantea]